MERPELVKLRDKITDRFREIVSENRQTPLLVDLEGVVMGYGFNGIQQLESDFLLEKSVEARIYRLPLNYPLLEIVEDLHKIGGDKSPIISASVLDACRHQGFVRASRTLEGALYRGHEILNKLSLPGTFDPDAIRNVRRIKRNALLISINDIDPRQAVLKCIKAWHGRQAENYKYLNLLVPRYTGQTNEIFKEELMTAIYNGLISEPLPVPADPIELRKLW